MPISDKQWALGFSLSLLTVCDPCNWPCKMWSGSRQPRLAMRVSLSDGEAQLAGCWRELEGIHSVGVGCRYPVTMHRESFITLSMRQM